MKLLPGQQIWEYKDQPKCGSCNIPYIDDSNLFNFQLKMGVNNFYSNDFNTNFFKEITGPYITFNPPAFASFYDTIIYCCGKVFRFVSIISTQYNYTVITDGNVITIEYPTISLLLDAFNNTIDVMCGTLSTYNLSLNTFTISSIPANSFMNVHNTQWSNITNISTQIADDASSFILNDSKMCYYGHLSVADNFYEIRPGTLHAGKHYKICFDYTAEYSDFSANIIIEDGTNTTTIPISIINGSTNVCAYYTALLSTNHTIRIELIDDSSHYTGFCIDNLSIDELCSVSNVAIKHVDGTYYLDHNIANGNMALYYHNENVLVQLNTTGFLLYYEFSPCKDARYQLTITDTCNNTIISNIFKIYHESCKSLIKLEWFSTCKFRDIDYLNLPFTNTLYVEGYTKRTPSISKNRVSTIGFDGSVQTIYSHTLKRYELNTGQYNEDVHFTVEQAFLHELTFVDGVKYDTEQGDLYVIRELRDYVYAGRIELIDNSDTIISTKCCC